jgi:hypothetical protein
MARMFVVFTLVMLSMLPMFSVVIVRLMCRVRRGVFHSVVVFGWAIRTSFAFDAMSQKSILKSALPTIGCLN